MAPRLGRGAKLEHARLRNIGMPKNAMTDMSSISPAVA